MRAYVLLVELSRLLREENKGRRAGSGASGKTIVAAQNACRTSEGKNAQRLRRMARQPSISAWA